MKRSSATDNDESNAPRSRCTRFVRGSVTLENTACILDTRYDSSFFFLFFFSHDCRITRVIVVTSSGGKFHD